MCVQYVKYFIYNELFCKYILAFSYGCWILNADF